MGTSSMFLAPSKLSGEVDGVKHMALARDVPRLLVEVDVVPMNGSAPVGVWWPHGVSTQVIYADELEMLKSRTRTDAHREAWARALKNTERDILRQIEEAWRPTSPKTPEKRAEIEKHVRSKTKLDAAVEVARDYRNGLPPVASFKILRDDVPPPATPEANQAALIQAVIGRSGGSDAALRAENDQLREMIGKLTTRLEAVEKSAKK